MSGHDVDTEFDEAMGLWRDDTARHAETFDPQRVTAAVLADIQKGEGASDPMATVLRRYAAAAAILIGLGTGGAAWLGPDPTASPTLSSSSALRLLEAGQLAHHERLALTAYPQPAAPRPETER